MPTLLDKGSIVKAKWMSKEFQKKIDTTPSIEVLIDYISDRVWENTMTPPKEKIRGIGDKVLILRSGTGSGKSTLLPPYLYNKFFELSRRNILITEPTKATTTDIPYQIIQYNKNLTMGDNIGFQTGAVAWKPIKGILFSTYGILLQHLKILTDEEMMYKYSFIIIDEVHSGTIEVESCMFYLKMLLKRIYQEPQCPFVILTSATFDPTIYMDYFECHEDNFLDVVGSSFPIQDIFVRYDISNYIQYCVDLVEKIHLENIKDITDGNEFRDILIFVQGGKQIKEIIEGINRLNSKVLLKGLKESTEHMQEIDLEKYKVGAAEATEATKEILGGKDGVYLLAPISVTSDNIQKGGRDYRDIFSDISNVMVDIYDYNGEEKLDKIPRVFSASRRVLIGTNAIETGMTIDTLGYCIDTGFVINSMFNPDYGVEMLIPQNITQASSRQRRGRVGRKHPGKFYALYTKRSFEQMNELPYPDIVKENIISFVLGVILDETDVSIEELSSVEVSSGSFQMNPVEQKWYSLRPKNVFSAKRLDFIQYPSAGSMIYCMETLQGLGFIDHEYQPTLFGYFASKIRKISMESIRMIFAGYHTGANVLDLITIAAFLFVGFKLGINRRKYKPRNPLNLDEQEAMYMYRMLFADEIIEYLFIWHDFMEIIDRIGTQIQNSETVGKNKRISFNYLEKWAYDNEFKLQGLFDVIQSRDEIITDLLSIGLNPYYNGLSMDKGSYDLVKILQHNNYEGIQEIKKIKQCILEGFRFNVCIWNNITKEYISQHRHFPVQTDSIMVKPLDDKRPIIIVTNRISVRISPSGIFEFIAEDISVLDGYFNVDLEFLNH